MKNFYVALTFALVGTLSQWAHAQKANPYKTTTTAPAPAADASYSSNYSTSSSKFALGYRRAATAVPGSGIGQLSGLIEFKPGIKAGIDFGFSGDFDRVLFNAELRYDLLTRGASSVFAEVDAGYIKYGVSVAGSSGEVKGFAGGLLLGYNYQLTSNLNLSAAYGLQVAFGSGTTDNHVAITNAGDFGGNFGIHWMY